MLSLILLPALLSLQPVVARIISSSPRQQPCADIHIFLARGIVEQYPGRQEPLVDAICDTLNEYTCDYEDIIYDNIPEGSYCDAVIEAHANGVAQITAYSERCPGSKIVVSGYSPGAHAVGDILGGSGGVFFEGCVQKDGPGLDADSKPGQQIVAALMFGSPRHTADQPYNVLTGVADNGMFPRTKAQLAKLATYGDRLRDYCVSTDTMCAQGNEFETHLDYFDIYTDGAAGWVSDMVIRAFEGDLLALPAQGQLV